MAILGRGQPFAPTRTTTVRSASVALTGTITTATENDIIAGGKTIILTLSGDSWIAAGSAFNLQRQNIIDGLDSGGAEGTGWDAVVKATAAVTDVVRTDAQTVTITLEAFGTYSITANETITATIPSTALLLGRSQIATPTFTITDSGAAVSTVVAASVQLSAFGIAVYRAGRAA